jgi:nicotinate-nucleotide pyrophosphorylase (carboxylating)
MQKNSQNFMNITKSEIMSILKEDKSSLDITTNSIIIQNKLQKFQIISKNPNEFILCGIDCISQAFESVMAKYSIDTIQTDGTTIKCGQTIVSGSCSVKELLQIERSCLNLIQHLSGISTKTHQFVQTLNDPKIKILDTRKTIPLIRKLQKYAITIGGGFNHRMNLAQMAMIKDNHIIATGSITQAVRLIKKNQPNIQIEVECETLEQVNEAIQSKVDIIMLDNMPIELIKEASLLIRSNSTIKIEISGGVNLSNISNYKNLDIDYISIGALTHSINAVDISMEFTE